MRLLLLTIFALVSATSTHAQSRPYVGGSAAVVTETRSESFQPGGRTWGGSVLFGVPVSSRWSVEFEPMFIGSLEDGEYTYAPSPVLRAHVMTDRRDTFFTFQLRAKTRLLEPVVGVSYVYAAASRHATIIQSGLPYFDDKQSQHALALAAGVDAAVALTSHLHVVPTIRVFLVTRPADDPIDEQTSGGPFAIRVGVGTRITF